MNPARRLIRLILSAAIVVTTFTALPASATLSGCIASISPQTVSIGSDTGFLIDVYNPDPSPIQWVRITSPDQNNFAIEDASAAGWNASTAADHVEFLDGSLAHASDQGFSVQALAGPTVVSQSWLVEASDAADGSDPIVCSGDTSVSITNNPSQINLSNIQISNIGPTSVTVTWDTDIAATTQVEYGTDTNYASSSSFVSALTTAHTVNLTGLTANTGYHYRVISTTPADGGTVSSSDNTFLTALPAPAPVIVVSGGGGANVPGATIKTTPTETVPPTISLTTNFTQPFEASPLIIGRADDNEALARIEYSLDGGTNWLPADRITQVAQNGRLSAAHVSFQFTPPPLEDGNYHLLARAIDTSGNSTATSPATLVIDRLPPQLGPLMISSGPEVFLPDDQGALELLAATDYKLSASAVGGPTAITLEAATTEQANPAIQTVTLTQEPDTGLWGGLLSFKTGGIYQLTARSLDGAGNRTSRLVATIAVTPAGRILRSDNHRPLERATITAYYFEPATQVWQVWQAAPYGQTNPQTTTTTGTYSLLLPPGRYYVKVQASGFRTYTSTSFDVSQPLGIASNLSLIALPQLKLGPITLTMPDLSWDATPLPASDQKPIAAAQSLAGQMLPDFSLPVVAGGSRRNLDLEGKPTVLSFLTSWSPGGQEQLAALTAAQANPDVNVVPIFSQERTQQVGVYLATSGSTLTALADPDGLLVPSLRLGAVPQHVFVDRTGRIKKVMLGVLSKDKLLDQLGGL